MRLRVLCLIMVTEERGTESSEEEEWRGGVLGRVLRSNDAGLVGLLHFLLLLLLLFLLCCPLLFISSPCGDDPSWGSFLLGTAKTDPSASRCHHLKFQVNNEFGPHRYSLTLRPTQLLNGTREQSQNSVRHGSPGSVNLTSSSIQTNRQKTREKSNTGSIAYPLGKLEG